MERNIHTLRSGGRLHYLDRGSGDVVLFIHGIWTNHFLWEGVIDALPDTFRGIAPDWPLGSQPEPFPRNADLSPRGIVDMVCEFMEALDLLVGCEPAMMLEATRKFAGFRAPVLLVWGTEDKLFPLQLAQDLTREFPDVRLVEVPGANVFLPLDAPYKVAVEIATFVRGRDVRPIRPLQR